MKITCKKYLKAAGILFISAILALSCSKKNNNTDKENQTTETTKNQRPQWQPTAEKICIIFGYGYNNEEFTKAEIEHLSEYFGLSDGTENSGAIIPYIFPDDFAVGNTGRISRLTKLLEDVKVAGVITIGAPDYTSNTLAALRDNMEEGKEYPIYTLFPQDDILAIEATSDFVLDKAVEQSDKVEEMKEEAEQVRITGIEEIIDNAIDNMQAMPKPLKSDSELYGHVSRIAGSSHSIKRYIDPETGLSSINHFIIEDKK